MQLRGLSAVAIAGKGPFQHYTSKETLGLNMHHEGLLSLGGPACHFCFGRMLQLSLVRVPLRHTMSGYAEASSCIAS